MNSELLFEEIFQEFPVPTIILQADTPDFTILEVNEMFLSLNGRSREALIGNGFFQCYPHPAMISEENIGMVRRSLHQVLEEKKTVRDSIQKYTQNPVEDQHSHVLYLQATNRPVVSESGQIKYIIRSLKDVTETVSTQIKEREITDILIKNEKFLKESQRIARIGSWEVDKDFRVRWSPLHYEIFETGQDFLPVFEDGINFFKGEDNQVRFRRVFDEARRTGKAFDEEFEIVTAKGNERWLRIIGKAEISNGESLRMYGVAQDITPKKTLELDLLHSRNQFAQLIQSIQGIVWEADSETFQMTFISEQVTNILGYNQEECLKQPRFWQNHLHPEDKEEVIQYTLAQINTRNHFSHVYRIMKKDGSYVWLQTSFSLIREKSQPTRIRSLMVDVTATKLLTDLEHLEKTVLELNSKPDASLQEVLRIYLKGICDLFDPMICSIMRIKNGRMYNWVSTFLPPDYEALIDGFPVGENSGSCGAAAFLKQPVIVSDIANDPLWAEYQQEALNENLRSCWSYPIISSSGEVMATLGMYYPTVKEPSEEELKVIERTASILKVIIEQNHYAELVEEANSLMRQSQELAHFGIFRWDIPADKLTWSKEMYAVFGIDPEVDVTQQGHFQLIHPDDRETVRAQVDQLLVSGEDQIFEERIMRPNGDIRHLKTWIRVKSDRSGEPIQMIGACIDMTENKIYEERLLASERRLRNILDSQTNYVVRIGLDFKYRYTNKKFIEDFALEGQESLIGLDALKTIREDQKEQVKEVIEECIARPNQIFSVELEKLVAQGFNKPTFWHFVCLTDSDGAPYEIQGIGIDISERKKAEEEGRLKTLELEASEKRYSDLFHLSPQPMYLFDTDTLVFLDVNTAAIEQYGYSRDEFLSMTIKEIRPKEEIAKLLKELAKAKENNVDFYRAIYTHLTKAGEVIHVDLHSNLIPYKERRVRLVLASNITDRIEYLKTLEIQNKKLTEIAWAQSHVVRAPLARIMALIDLIKNYPELNEENEELLGYIFTSAVELDEVIKDISRKAEEVKLDDMSGLTH